MASHSGGGGQKEGIKITLSSEWLITKKLRSMLILCATEEIENGLKYSGET